MNEQDLRHVLKMIGESIRSKRELGVDIDPDFEDALQEVMVEELMKLGDSGKLSKLPVKFQSAEHYKKAVLKLARMRRMSVRKEKLDSEKTKKIFRKAVRKGSLTLVEGYKSACSKNDQSNDVEPLSSAEIATAGQDAVQREAGKSLLMGLQDNPAALEESINSLPPMEKAVFLDLVTERDKSETCQELEITDKNYRKLKSRSQSHVRNDLAGLGFPLKDLPIFLNSIRQFQTKLIRNSNPITSSTSEGKA